MRERGRQRADRDAHAPGLAAFTIQEHDPELLLVGVVVERTLHVRVHGGA